MLRLTMKAWILIMHNVQLRVVQNYGFQERARETK